MNKIHACCLPVVIGLFGSIGIGCVPTGEAELAKYDIDNYSANTDSSGFAGTWLFTNNNESSSPISPYRTYHTRELVRIRPLADDATTYEFLLCAPGPGGTDVTDHAVASNDTITLPVGMNLVETATFTMTSDGHMEATVETANNTVTWRAVRLSGNPDFNAGTVAIDFAYPGLPSSKQPTGCFIETRTTATGSTTPTHSLVAIGLSEEGYAYASYSKSPTQTLIQGSFEPPGFGGVMLDGKPNINTLQSKTDAITGRAATLGSTPEAAGAIALDITL